MYFTDFCQNFFKRRPITKNTTKQYQSPGIGKFSTMLVCNSAFFIINIINMPILLTGVGHGDPHYLTFDSRCYTFNRIGDYLLLEALDEMGQTSEFTLQGRLGMVNFWSVSTHKALAFGQPGMTFHVSVQFLY